MKLHSQINLLEGKFLTEHNSRFLCTVCVDGEEMTCYVPSSCKLGNLIDLNNRTVLLKKNSSAKTRTKYAVYAVKYGRNYILLNLAQVNNVIASQLHRRFFSSLGHRKSVFQEKYIEGYRADLFIQDTHTLIEVKTLLSLEKNAHFPSVHSERAITQLYKLDRLLDEGYNVCYLIVSLTPRVKEIQISNASSEFYDLFQRCVRKGMTVHAVSICMTEDKFQIHSTIKVSY